MVIIRQSLTTHIYKENDDLGLSCMPMSSGGRSGTAVPRSPHAHTEQI